MIGWLVWFGWEGLVGKVATVSMVEKIGMYVAWGKWSVTQFAEDILKFSKILVKIFITHIVIVDPHYVVICNHNSQR